MTGRTIGNRLAVAQARAEEARARFSGTIGALQERARPTSLVHDVTDTLKERGTDMVVGLMDATKRKPVRTGAIVALFALFLARRPLIRLLLSAISGPSKSSPSKTPKRGSSR